MRVAVSGSTGLIGSALVEDLRAAGHSVVRLVRDPDASGGDDVHWSPSEAHLDAAAMEGLDGVVHLAGAPIGPRPWTPSVKREILASRRDGTRLLADTLASLTDPPRVLVSGSAIGWYGAARGDTILTEASPSEGDGFLTHVCHVWEDAAQAAVDDDRITVAFARTGLVMSGDGGLLPIAALPFRLGLGGTIGSGRQWMSWISLDDEVAALRHLLEHPVAGPVNLTGPVPVTNAQWTRALGEVLGRPTVLAVPAPLLKATLGEMARQMLLASQRVLPTVLEESGFEFRHRDVDAALRAALEQPR